MQQLSGQYQYECMGQKSTGLDIGISVAAFIESDRLFTVESLNDLAALAPLHAVRGNPHLTDLSDGGRDLPVEGAVRTPGRAVFP